MKVKMLTLSCSPAGVRKVNDVVEVSEEEGKALVEGKYAVCVEQPVAAPVVEKVSVKGKKVEEPVKEPEEV